MDEEEEDRELLNTLGVTSANPEDIERDILEKARKDGVDGAQAAGGSEGETVNGTKSDETSSSSHGKLVNKLRAVELEIDAVTAAVEQFKNCKRDEDHFSDGEEKSQLGEEEVERNGFQSSTNDLALQHALASDRLRTLKKTRAEIKKEISDSSTNKGNDRLIRSLIKEEPKSKRRLKEVDKTTQNKKKRVKKVSFSEDDDFDAVLNAASAGFVETERDELIRKGVLTPFHKLHGYERRIQEPGPSTKRMVSLDAVEHNDMASTSISRAVKSMSDAVQARPTTKLLDRESVPRIDAPSLPFQRLKKPLKIPRSLDLESEKDKGTKRKKRRPQPGKKWKRLASRDENLQECDEKFSEEGDWKTSSDEDVADLDDEGAPFVTLEGGLKIPETIFNNLFDYQKVGVQWLWELHCQRAGGIIGDEMGLGKTIQVISFLGSLHFSGMYAPSIIICPVTLLRQWKREAKKWYPHFHVEMLHDSAQDVPSRKKQSRSNDSDRDSEDSIDSDHEEKSSTKNIKKWDSLIKRVLRSESGLLITTYEQLRLHGDKLLDIEWGYAVLDEGHRIRNPNAEVTLVCKQLQTVHRIIMTGAPIQNKLSELWSLFDFVFPGKLGVLPVFEAEFAVPISVGGYANATPLQVSTAYRCAVVLRDLIMPYLLRRMKADVEAHLPKKTEHVLFCSLTPEQRSVYRAFLASSEVEQIFDGNRNSLSGIDVMRKICNHPDLLEREHCHGNPDYGNPKRSGKMKVVAEVLKVWKEQGHRVLLFAQTQQMLDIIESFLIADGYSYRRMDGVTPVKQRMALIDEYNNTNDVFIFILTTKVGGLGTNLTGANRVIIFDPDWNPSTDIQARERAWRIGQKKDVTVYRLITRGTIEEKVYQRQIYKHFLTNKILKNPQQRRFFKARDMKDLFTLNDDGNGGSTETSSIFSQLPPDVINVVGAHQDKQEQLKLAKPSTSDADVSVTESGGNSGLRKTDEDKGNHVGVKEDETNFLQSLFESHGIHSAMNHDAIMNAHDEDKVKLEEHASKVAQRAAEALRQSRMLRSRESITVPTWTGKAGAAGAPSTVKRKFGSTTNSQLLSTSNRSEVVLNNDTTRLNGLAAGASSGKALSSAELLARIRGNQEKAVSDGLEHQFASSSSSNRPNGTSRLGNNSGMLPELVIRQMCTFIQRQGGSTSSTRIVDHFKDRIPSKDLPLFKNLLKEIATLEKGPDGSHWVLKQEYRDQ